MIKNTKNSEEIQIIDRTIVVPIIRDTDNSYLICKMPKNRGVFPGQWGLPGGGIEPGENMYAALTREIREELGNIHVEEVIPWTFREETHLKTFSENEKKMVHMIFLMFDCKAVDKNITLNDEFEKHAWVAPNSLHEYDLNKATVTTFIQKGLLRT